MAQNPIRCFSCSKQFLSSDEMLLHIQHFQPSNELLKRLDWHKAQFLKLFDVVQALQEHRDPGFVWDTESSAESTAGSDSPRQSAVQDLGIASVTKQRRQYRCPRPGCRHKRYPRKQELIRHYATHVTCEVCCETCSITFVEASKYLNHKCAKASLMGRKMYDSIRMRVEEDLVSCNIQKHTSGGTAKSKPCPSTSEVRWSSHTNLTHSQHDLRQEDRLTAPVETLNYNAGIDLPPEMAFTAQHPISTSFPNSANSEFQARYTYLAGLFDNAPGSGGHSHLTQTSPWVIPGGRGADVHASL